MHTGVRARVYAVLTSGIGCASLVSYCAALFIGDFPLGQRLIPLRFSLQQRK